MVPTETSQRSSHTHIALRPEKPANLNRDINDRTFYAGFCSLDISSRRARQERWYKIRDSEQRSSKEIGSTISTADSMNHQSTYQSVRYQSDYTDSDLTTRVLRSTFCGSDGFTLAKLGRLHIHHWTIASLQVWPAPLCRFFDSHCSAASQCFSIVSKRESYRTLLHRLATGNALAYIILLPQYDFKVQYRLWILTKSHHDFWVEHPRNSVRPSLYVSQHPIVQ